MGTQKDPTEGVKIMKRIAGEVTSEEEGENAKADGSSNKKSDKKDDKPKDKNDDKKGDEKDDKKDGKKDDKKGNKKSAKKKESEDSAEETMVTITKSVISKKKLHKTLFKKGATHLIPAAQYNLGRAYFQVSAVKFHNYFIVSFFLMMAHIFGASARKQRLKSVRIPVSGVIHLILVKDPFDGSSSREQRLSGRRNDAT